jgi:hypothetical protein
VRSIRSGEPRRLGAIRRGLRDVREVDRPLNDARRLEDDHLLAGASAGLEPVQRSRFVSAADRLMSARAA